MTPRKRVKGRSLVEQAEFWALRVMAAQADGERAVAGRELAKVATQLTAAIRRMTGEEE